MFKRIIFSIIILFSSLSYGSYQEEFKKAADSKSSHQADTEVFVKLNPENEIIVQRLEEALRSKGMSSQENTYESDYVIPKHDYYCDGVSISDQSEPEVDVHQIIRELAKAKAGVDLNNIKFTSKPELRHLRLFYDRNGFHIENLVGVIDVPNENVEKDLRNISIGLLIIFLQHGELRINQIGENEYVIRGSIKGVGGDGTILDGVKWLIKAVIKDIIKDAVKQKAMEWASHYWKKYYHPNPEQVNKVKQGHQEEAKVIVTKKYNEIEKTEMFKSIKVGEWWKRYVETKEEIGYIRDYMLDEFLLTASGRQLKPEIIEKIAFGFLLEPRDFDKIYNYMHTSTLLKAIGF